MDVTPRIPEELAGQSPRLRFINFELVDMQAFQLLIESTYATDRNLVSKGIVEVRP